MTVVGSGASTLSTMMKLFWRALVTPCGGKTIFCQLAATSCGGQRRAVMEFDALADLEGVGLAVIGRLRHLGAEIADEVGRSGRILRIDADQHAVEWRCRVDRRVGCFPMAVELGGASAGII